MKQILIVITSAVYLRTQRMMKNMTTIVIVAVLLLAEAVQARVLLLVMDTDIDNNLQLVDHQYLKGMSIRHIIHHILTDLTVVVVVVVVLPIVILTAVQTMIILFGGPIDY